jgi:competence protein ComEC
LDLAGSEWRPARAGDSFAVDSVTFEILHPSSEWASHEMEPNENSVVMRMTYGCFTALLTGDIGFPVESLLLTEVGQADLLKVAHHGSGGSTGQAWLDAVNPRLAVISVGKNRFGHPTPAVLRRLEHADVPVFRTDKGGTVTIRSDGSYLESEQGAASYLAGKFLRLMRGWLRSNGLSSDRRGNERQRQVTMPACTPI